MKYVTPHTHRNVKANAESCVPKPLSPPPKNKSGKLKNKIRPKGKIPPPPSLPATIGEPNKANRNVVINSLNQIGNFLVNLHTNKHGIMAISVPNAKIIRKSAISLMSLIKFDQATVETPESTGNETRTMPDCPDFGGTISNLPW